MPILLAIINLLLGCTSVYAGHFWENSPAIISGPANCRKIPNGKILRSLKDRESVKLIQEKADWFYIQQGSLKCWTYKNNIAVILDIPISESDNQILESLPSPEPPMLNKISLENGVSVAETLLKFDPCFLLKFPSGDASLAAQAREKCDAKHKAKEGYSEISCPLTYSGPESGWIAQDFIVRHLPPEFQSVGIYSSKVDFSQANCAGTNGNLFICHYGRNPTIALKAECKSCILSGNRLGRCVVKQ